ncbi:MAG: hypothetical protein DRQ55_02665 [Planctomycetota bacterium]|nr:MAG: hypothetical protein DRQ55_02665 [Planctomycetota bacterium]
MTDAPVRFADTIIFPASLDPKAVTVVERLSEAGYESYLVGGCVRDLLLGHIPKDFDVSTEARPRQIRRVFRNCRVIGRRFKLAHVHFGSLVIEVATFRRTPEEGEQDPKGGESVSDDLLIVRDNLFGTSEEDARRRDFTINALLFDVGRAEVIDWVGGFKDLQARVLRTIGEPEVRLAEDPVRMLRAIKFTSRLSLTLDPELEAAMHTCAPLIERSAPPRVLEEIYKLLSCGKAEVSLAMLLKFGLLSRLLPDVGPYWEQHPDQLVALGRALDHADGGKRQLSNALMLSLLYCAPWLQQLEDDPELDPMAAAAELIAPAAVGMSVPRRDVGRLKGLLTTQHRLERPRRGRRMRLSEFLVRPAVQEAIDLLYLRCLAGAADPEVHASWTQKLTQTLGEVGRPGAEPQSDGEQQPKRSSSRRRRRRRSGSGRGRSGEERPRTRPDGDAERTPESSSQSADKASSSGETSATGEPSASGRAGAPSSEGRKQTAGAEGRPRRAPRSRAEPTDSRSRPSRPGTQASPSEDRPAKGAAAQAGASGGSSPAPSDRAPSAAPSDAAPPTARGIKGLMGRLVRKVLGQDDGPIRDDSSTSEPAPPGASAGPGPTSSPVRSPRAPRSATEETSAKRPSKAAPKRQSPAQSAGSGAAADASETQDEQGETPRPKRRRRRRRSGSDAQGHAAGADGGSTSADTQGESETDAKGDGGSEATDQTSRKGSSSAGSEARPKRRRSRRSRGGSGRTSKGAEHDAEQSGESSSKPRTSGDKSAGRSRGRSDDKPGGRSGGKSGSKSGGRSGKGRDSRGRSSDEGGRRRSGDDAESRPRKEPAEQSGPGQRHPEDVEDIFDW